MSQFGFGASAGTLFGAAPGGAFGAKPPFGTPGATSLFPGAPGGATSPFPAAGGSLFGAQASQPAFGGGGFGMPQPQTQAAGFGGAFGQPSSAGLFGQSAGMFGTSAPAFGGSPGGMFGAQVSQPAMGGFGAAPQAASAGLFGAGAGGFGAPASPGAGGLFGTPASAAMFGQAGAFGAGAGMGAPVAVGTKQVPWNATQEMETTGTGPQQKQTPTNQQSITAMPAYKTKSVEELRCEDYKAGVKGGSGQPGTPPAGGMFGAPGVASPVPGAAPNQFGFGAAGGMGAPSAPAFGAAASGGMFGAGFGAPSSAGMFGAGMGQSSPSPWGAGMGAASQPGMFGAASSASLFGGAAFGASAPSMPGFGAATSAPAFGGMAPTTPSPWGGGMGAPSQPGMFGAASSAGLFGAAGFGASAPSMPGFGAATSAPAFGGMMGASSAAAFGMAGGIPGFGASTSSFMMGGSAGALGAAKPPGFGGFPASTAASAPGMFGMSTPMFGASSPAPAMGGLGGGGMFGASSAAGGMFGASTGGFGSAFSMPSFSISASSTAAPTMFSAMSAPANMWGGASLASPLGMPGASTMGAPAAVTAPAAVSSPYGALPMLAGVGALAPGAVAAAPVSLTTGPAPAGVGTPDRLAGSSMALQARAPRTITPRLSARMPPRRTPTSGAAARGAAGSPMGLWGYGGASTPDTAPDGDIFKPRDNPRKLFLPRDAPSGADGQDKTPDTTPARLPAQGLLSVGTLGDDGRRSVERSPAGVDTPGAVGQAGDHGDGDGMGAASVKGKEGVNEVVVDSSGIQTKPKATRAQASNGQDGLMKIVGKVCKVAWQGGDNSPMQESTSKPAAAASSEKLGFFDRLRSGSRSEPAPTNGHGNGHGGPSPGGVEAKLPQLSRAGYYCKPTLKELAELARHNPAALAAVRDFTVGKADVGEIRWEKETDVRGLELDSIVDIVPNMVYVYKGQDASAPPVGQELNRPAMVTLYGVYPKLDKRRRGPTTDRTIIDKFKKQLAEIPGAQLLEYDPQGGIWRFRVENFRP